MGNNDNSWNNIPPILLLEVYSFLNRNDICEASSTCKHWRSVLFQTHIFENVNLSITEDEDDLLRTRFFIFQAYRKFRHVTLKFNSLNPLCVREMAKGLKKISSNHCIRSIVLLPSHSHISCPGSNGIIKQAFFENRIISPLKSLLGNTTGLEALNLGFSEDLIEFIYSLLPDVLLRFSGSLRILNLASVKDDPDNYNILPLNVSVLPTFQKLQVLSLDYDYISDAALQFLCGFSNNGVNGLKRLNVHVHGVDESHESTTDEAWQIFRQHNPNCQLRLSLIHSYDGVDILADGILKPSMPLTHLKVLFCEKICEGVFYFVSDWYKESLLSLIWVDSLNQVSWDTPVAGMPHPLLMFVWKCKKLEELVLIGYKFYSDDLVGCARLRGGYLKKFDIPAECIIYEDLNNDEMCDKVSQALGRRWKPLEDLQEVFRNPITGDSDDYVVPLVTEDQILNFV